MAIGFIYTTLSEVEVVEGLLLFLTWLFPSTPTSGENNFAMCGSLVHLAIRPYVLDFIRLYEVKTLLELRSD